MEPFTRLASNSQVAKDAKEQKERHAKNLWPNAHLVDETSKTLKKDLEKMYGPTRIAKKRQKFKSKNTKRREKIYQRKNVVAPTPKALAATVERDPNASHSLKLEKAAFKLMLMTMTI